MDEAWLTCTPIGDGKPGSLFGRVTDVLKQLKNAA